MAELNLQRVREAWRSASSADIVQALKEPDEYAPAVLAIIREEADRRGLTADSEEALPPPTYESLRRVSTPITGVMRDGWRRVIPREPLSSPFIRAALLGLTYLAATVLLSWLITPIGCWVAYVVGLFWLCRPLRTYRLPLLIPLISGSVSIAILVVALVWLSPSPQFILTGFDWGIVCIGGAIRVAMDVAAPIMLLVSTVFVRNRFWPAPKPGYCRVCDYDLRGLPEPRCPECGTPFDAAEPTAEPADEPRSDDNSNHQQ